MTNLVLTVSPEESVQEALVSMRKEHIRRFPVVDKKENWSGSSLESDLLNASPSEATSLSVWEISYLVSKITVERVMTKDVITVTEDTPIEEAARIMADKKIGALPVMKGDKLVGIITERIFSASSLSYLELAAKGLGSLSSSKTFPVSLQKLPPR